MSKETEASKARFREGFQKIISELEPREGEILTYRFGIDRPGTRRGKPRTPEQTAQHFGIDAEEMERLESLVLKQIHKLAEDELARLPPPPGFLWRTS